MATDYFLCLAGALIAGTLIGLERSYHGRAAGMRTYALVCLGSALVVLAASFPHSIAAGAADPGVTRVVQGIVTGIGFLGAGVIVKEGLSVRGLTTAASIWVTAGIGILIGLGAYAVAAAATVVTLGTLSVFRLVEDRMPAQCYLHCYVRFPIDDRMDEDSLRELLGRNGFQLAELSYRLHGEPKRFEYRMVVWSRDPAAGRKLAEVLTARDTVAEFRISPSRD